MTTRDEALIRGIRELGSLDNIIFFDTNAVAKDTFGKNKHLGYYKKLKRASAPGGAGRYLDIVNAEIAHRDIGKTLLTKEQRNLLIRPENTLGWERSSYNSILDQIQKITKKFTEDPENLESYRKGLISQIKESEIALGKNELENAAQMIFLRDSGILDYIRSYAWSAAIEVKKKRHVEKKDEMEIDAEIAALTVFSAYVNNKPHTIVTDDSDMSARIKTRGYNGLIFEMGDQAKSRIEELNIEGTKPEGFYDANKEIQICQRLHDLIMYNKLNNTPAMISVISTESFAATA